jgi:hypothetical protein
VLGPDEAVVEHLCLFLGQLQGPLSAVGESFEHDVRLGPSSTGVAVARLSHRSLLRPGSDASRRVGRSPHIRLSRRRSVVLGGAAVTAFVDEVLGVAPRQPRGWVRRKCRCGVEKRVVAQGTSRRRCCSCCSDKTGDGELYDCIQTSSRSVPSDQTRPSLAKVVGQGKKVVVERGEHGTQTRSPSGMSGPITPTR